MMNEIDNKSLNETKRNLDIIQNIVTKNKISVNDFVYYYMFLRAYIFLGAKDYLPYAKALFNAEVIIKTALEQETYDHFIEEFNNMIIGSKDKVRK